MLRWLLLTVFVCMLTPSCAWLDEELLLDDEAYAATFGDEEAGQPALPIITLGAMHIGGCGLHGFGYGYSGYSTGHLRRSRLRAPDISLRVPQRAAAQGGAVPGLALQQRDDEEEEEIEEPDALTQAATRGARHMIERDQERHRALAAWITANVEAP